MFIKQFFNASAAAQYVVDNNLPLESLCKGRNGMSAVKFSDIGGVITAPSYNVSQQGKRRYSL